MCVRGRGAGEEEREGDTLGTFFSNLYKGDNLCEFLFAFTHQDSSEKASILKKKKKKKKTCCT